MSASQSLIHGVRSPLQANVVHLCTGHIVHNNLLGPGVVSDPISGSYSILLWRHTLDRAIDIASNIAANKYAVHLLLPIIPIIVSQMASFREPINCRIVCTDQSYGRRVIGW